MIEKKTKQKTKKNIYIYIYINMYIYTCFLTLFEHVGPHSIVLGPETNEGDVVEHKEGFR